jgi:hypothetical protein
MAIKNPQNHLGEENDHVPCKSRIAKLSGDIQMCFQRKIEQLASELDEGDGV